MAKALVIVESPAKAKTINKYLGRDYKVVASMGHVRDLPKSQLGVDVDAGFERDSRRQLASNIRTFPLRFSGIRSHRQNNWDLSLIKNTGLREGVRLQFRAEALNALNHPQFQAPNTSPTSTSFGQVTQEWSYPRVFQFSLKILF